MAEYTSRNVGEQRAVVVTQKQGLFFVVRLADTKEVLARVPKQIARDMFRIIPGDRVRVEGPSDRLRTIGFDG